MTNKLEKQFFDTFGIEPKYNDCCMIADKYWANEELSKYITFDDFLNCECPHINEGCFSTCEYAYDKIEYPQITDRILLELICILNRYFNATGEYPIMLLGLNYESLKEYILKRCIHNEYNIKQQVQAIFKEG